MLIVILIVSILTFLGVAGNASKLSSLESRMRLKGTFLDDVDDVFGEPDFIETPVKLPKTKKPRKQAVKQTTTLKKVHHAKSQTRSGNGRFAKKVS